MAIEYYRLMTLVCDLRRGLLCLVVANEICGVMDWGTLPLALEVDSRARTRPEREVRLMLVCDRPAFPVQPPAYDNHIDSITFIHFPSAKPHSHGARTIPPEN